MAEILPTLAVVTDSDTPTYTQVPLSDIYSDTLPSNPQDPEAPHPSFFSLGLGLRPLLSQLLSLRTRFKPLALFRGLSVFAVLDIFEALVAVLSFHYLPSLLAILPQILLPLMLVQLYTLWTHTVLTYPSARPVWQRIPPFKATLRATGPALAVFLAVKALLKFALMSVYRKEGSKSPGILAPQSLGPALLVGIAVEVIGLVPAHLILTRIQASLLPADERMIVPIDKALSGGGNGEESAAVGMKEAWRTFGWGAWKRLVVLYVQVFVVVLVGGGVVLVVDFVFFIFIGLMGLL